MLHISLVVQNIAWKTVMESYKLLMKTRHKQEQGSIRGFSWVSTTSLLTATPNISRKLSILSFKVFKPNLCGSSF